jgi:hypothetical protein
VLQGTKLVPGHSAALPLRANRRHHPGPDAAESKEEAERYAQENYRDELRETAYPGVMAYAPRKPLSHCPPDWNGCPPSNSDDDRTVDEWFKEPSDLPQVP